MSDNCIKAMLQSVAKIKPLTWYGFGLEMWSDSIVGKYYISGHGGKWSWSFDDDDPYFHGTTVVSEDDAKIAAQSHYEGLISSAFTSRDNDASQYTNEGL